MAEFDIQQSGDSTKRPDSISFLNDKDNVKSLMLKLKYKWTFVDSKMQNSSKLCLQAQLWWLCNWVRSKILLNILAWNHRYRWDDSHVTDKVCVTCDEISRFVMMSWKRFIFVRRTRICKLFHFSSYGTTSGPPLLCRCALVVNHFHEFLMFKSTVSKFPEKHVELLKCRIKCYLV